MSDYIWNYMVRINYGAPVYFEDFRDAVQFVEKAEHQGFPTEIFKLVYRNGELTNAQK